MYMDDRETDPGARPGAEGDANGEVEWLDLYPIYDAPNEDSAIHVCALLQGAGIEARIRSAQIPCFDGAFASAVGYWGQVVVPRDQVLLGRALVEAFTRTESGGAASDSA